VLTGVTRSERWSELSAAALDPVWELLRRHAEYIVIDVGFCLERDEELQYDTRAPQRNGATLSALAAADVVLAVGSAEPLSMQRLVHGLAALDDVVPASDAPRVVAVNRVRAAVAGARPREAVADALARYSAVEHVWTIPFDAKACDAATLAGQALSERAPHSAARRAIAGIADAVAAATQVAAPSGSSVPAHALAKSSR
jgi:MinD-like ATPase involved in chromosome partitioning or flagellar assembly